MKHTPPPTKTPRQIWFPAKRYGWGWGPPVCWQGWLVTAAYVAAMAGGAVWLGGPKRAPIFVAYALTLSFLPCRSVLVEGRDAPLELGRPAA